MSEAPLPHSSNNPGTLAWSYLALRQAIGALGIALPFVLSLGAIIVFRTGLQASLSEYYHTGMRDVFVGTLCAIGVFLFSYKGHTGKDDNDNLVGNFAGVFAIGVALFPTDLPSDAKTPQTTIGIVHVVFASLFFLTLAYFSLFLFTKTDPTKTPTPRKRRRNQVYRVCGYTIVTSIVLIFLLSILPANIQEAVSACNPVYWLESLAVVAFGVSWLTKGEAILQDLT